MPRLHRTPIRVAHPFTRIWGADGDPEEEDLRDFVRKQAPWLAGGDPLARKAIEAAADGGASLDQLVAWYSGTYRAARLAMAIGYIRSLAYLAIYQCEDAASLDDYFFTQTNPYIDQVFHKALEERGPALGKWIDRWITQRQEAIPRLRTPRRESLFMQAEGASGNQFCWHVQPHGEVTRERTGPKNNLGLRAATWGTYWISWLVGSDKEAVFVWNHMLFPADFYWGNGTTWEYASKKYNDSKWRLLSDLERQMGIRNIGTPRGSGPVCPMDSATARALDAFVLANTQQSLRAAFGLDEFELFDRLIIHRSRLKLEWPSPEPAGQRPKRST